MSSEKKEEEPRRDCPFYNYLGESSFQWPNFLSAYGARCEFYGKFFLKKENGKIFPKCSTCKGYFGAKKLVNLVNQENLDWLKKV